MPILGGLQAWFDAGFPVDKYVHMPETIEFLVKRLRDEGDRSFNSFVISRL
jgi:hypothetical protein